MYAVEEMARDIEAFRAAVKDARPYRPVFVKVKLVWSCNLRCRMCNHWRTADEGVLPFDRWQSVINELADLGCRKIHITGGEPALHPDLVRIVGHAASRGLCVTMTTNGTLIAKNTARALADAGLRAVNVSIDSPDRRIHDRMRGVKRAWKEAVKGIGSLVRRMKPRRVRLNTVIGRINYESLGALPDFAARMGAGALFLMPIDIHTQDARPLSVKHIARYNELIAPVVAEKALAAGLIQHRGEAFPFGRRPSEIRLSKGGLYAHGYYEAHRCHAPWTHALIDHMGRVTVCCMMREKPVMGDLRERSFSEIWSGREFAGLRSRGDMPLFEACRRCDMFLDENRRLDRLLRGLTPDP